MAEVFFYHLEQRSWEQVLPQQLKLALERGWRAVVQTAEAAQVAKISELLWAAEPSSFLAHGSSNDSGMDDVTKTEAFAARQPIWLTSAVENPNHANLRFYLHGAPVTEVGEMQRIVILFDGHDEKAVLQARNDWRSLKAEGHQISYWQQDENLRWVNRSA